MMDTSYKFQIKPPNFSFSGYLHQPSKNTVETDIQSDRGNIQVKGICEIFHTHQIPASNFNFVFIWYFDTYLALKRLRMALVGK
jgi:hypothetical protein